MGKLSPQEQSALRYAELIVEEDYTIRETAIICDVSKSTVWFYVHKYLPTSFPKVYEELKEKLEKHKARFYYCRKKK